MDWNQLLVLLLILTVRKSTTVCFAHSIIPWAPLSIKTPYMTFINDPFHPTWQTRHQQSKTKLFKEKVMIPTVYNISFSITCGACYTYSYFLYPKLTINVDINEETEGRLLYETFPDHNKYYIGCKIYECKMTTVKIKLNNPLETLEGRIICHLNRGIQHTKEILLFKGISRVEIRKVENNQCALPINLTLLNSFISSRTFSKNEDICYIYPIVSSTRSFLFKEETPLLVYQINYTHQSNHVGLSQELCFKFQWLFWVLGLGHFLIH